MSVKLTMLGTGYATAMRCYNTCFLLQSADTLLMVDAGGGNGVLNQLERVGVPLEKIHHLFLPHAHTDHVLGAVWVVRMILQMMKKGKYYGTLHLYGNDKVVNVLQWICQNTIPMSLLKFFDERVVVSVLQDGELFTINDWHLVAFDIHSTKEKQYGFRVDFANQRSLACLGDEPYNAANKSWVKDVDWLLCEAFCLRTDAEKFQPYEKHHSTAKDAAQLANELKIKNLLLYHTEDTSLATRKQSYTAEAQSFFSGNVVVPNDLETIELF